MPEDISVKNEPKQVEKKEYNFEFDELKMYYGLDYRVNKNIIIHIPTIGEILEFGESRVYSSISPFVSNPTTYRTQLWDMGVDWNKLSDFELFVMLVQGSKIEDTSLIFGEVDFGKLKPYGKEDTREIVLYDPEQQLEIDEETYMHIREYIRMVFNQYPKEELAKGKLAKLWIIDEEKDKIKREAEKNKGRKKSTLLPLVSALLNHPGFKYDLDGTKKIGIFAFMDSVRRLQVYEQCISFSRGMHSGMMDVSKLGEEELNKRLNWLQDIYEK